MRETARAIREEFYKLTRKGAACPKCGARIGAHCVSVQNCVTIDHCHLERVLAASDWYAVHQVKEQS